MKRFITLAALALLAFWIGQAQAQQQTNNRLSQSFLAISTSVPTQIQGTAKNGGRNYIQIQNRPDSTGNVYVCFCMTEQGLTCSSANAGMVLSVGSPWYITVGMYTGLGAQQLPNSGVFTCSISVLGFSGTTDNVAVTIE